MANGRVITGYSMPRVALYSATGGTVAYTDGMALARGVNVTLTPDDAGDDNVFYADNQAAERVAGTFNGGTISMTVDGLLDAARQMVLGIPAPTQETVGQQTVDAYIYNDDQNIPYVGLGWIVRYMQDGITTYEPHCALKVRFSNPSESAATQEEDIDWQTTELEATMLRADDAKHGWFKTWAAQPTEDAALAILDAFLNVA